MSEPESQAPLETDPEGYAPSVARRMAFYQRAGGIVTPIMTAVVAFLAGGIVVLATGHNPWRTYKAIFEGSGLNWLSHFGNYSIHVPFTGTHVWFWWDTNTNHVAAYNLTQTLLTTTPLILTGLAVAFAFRCGLFNIGGQGQYLIGTIVGVYIGSRFTDMGQLPHVLFALVCRRARRGALGCDRRLPESDGRRARGDHDDHAELDRVLGRELSLRPRRPAAEPLRQGGPDLGRHRRQREAADAVG